MPELRPMNLSDLDTVLKIIHNHDEDDAEAAEEDFLDNGVEDQFVLEIDEQIIGVTGYREVPATDSTFWLSWTYLDEDFQRQGLGRAMLLELLEKLRGINGRKLFVKVSDYDDPEDGKIYERALNVYQALGFKEQVISHDFYDEGENQTILGLNIQEPPTGSKEIETIDIDSKNADTEDAVFEDTDPTTSEPAPQIQDEKPIIRFNGLYEIGDSDGAYTFSWEVKKTKSLFGKRNFTVEDLVLGLQGVKENGGRKVFLTFPSNLPLIHKPLQAAGFKYVGTLEDYYEQGVHELHFSHDLNNI